MSSIEAEIGVTFAEVGIEFPASSYSGRDIKTRCPECSESHSWSNRNHRDLSVNIEDGVWNCHRCGYSGSLKSEAHKLGREAKMDPNPIRVQTRARGAEFAPQAYPAAVLPSNTLEDWAETWLEEERAIPTKVAVEFGITSTAKKMENGEIARTVHIPYYLDGKLVNVKSRTLPKEFRQTRGAARTLFNIDRCQGSKVIVITEGEFDVIACHIAGWKAVSSPDGAPGQIYEGKKATGKVAEIGKKGAAFETPEARKLFEDADRVIIATDADIEGKALASYLIETLGPMKCWQVHWNKWGAKDANEVLVRDGAKKLDHILSHAIPAPTPGLRPLSEQKEALRRIYDHGYAPGVSSGWEEFDHYFRPELGKLYIVSGYPGRGKTSWLNHFLTNLARINDWRVGLYSPEMGEEGEMLGKFVQIILDAPFLPSAEKRPSWEAVEIAADWVGDKFFEIYAEENNAQGFAALTIPKILAQAEPAVIKSGMNVLVIDPWNECESARNKGATVEEYISQSLSTIRQWCKRRNCSAIIVIHPRKPDTAKTMDRNPSPMEAAGAMHWYNKADVFVTINRVMFGEDKGKTLVEIAKHRKEGITGEVGICEFLFDRATGRFRYAGHRESSPIGSDPYIPLPEHLLITPRTMVPAGTLFDEENDSGSEDPSW